jgi:TRAP-type C4-dicarboxylate transport system permease small subunit
MLNSPLTLFSSTYIHKKLNERQIKLIDGILALLIAGTVALLTYQSAIFAITGMKVESLTLPWIKNGYVHIAQPLFMMSVCYYYLKSFFKNIAFIFKKK